MSRSHDDDWILGSESSARKISKGQRQARNRRAREEGLATRLAAAESKLTSSQQGEHSTLVALATEQGREEVKSDEERQEVLFERDKPNEISKSNELSVTPAVRSEVAGNIEETEETFRGNASPSPAIFNTQVIRALLEDNENHMEGVIASLDQQREDDREAARAESQLVSERLFQIDDRHARLERTVDSKFDSMLQQLIIMSNNVDDIATKLSVMESVAISGEKSVSRNNGDAPAPLPGDSSDLVRGSQEAYTIQSLVTTTREEDEAEDESTVAVEEVRRVAGASHVTTRKHQQVQSRGADGGHSSFESFNSSHKLSFTQQVPNSNLEEVDELLPSSRVQSRTESGSSVTSIHTSPFTNDDLEQSGGGKGSSSGSELEQGMLFELRKEERETRQRLSSLQMLYEEQLIKMTKLTERQAAETQKVAELIETQLSTPLPTPPISVEATPTIADEVITTSTVAQVPATKSVSMSQVPVSVGEDGQPPVGPFARAPGPFGRRSTLTVEGAAHPPERSRADHYGWGRGDSGPGRDNYGRHADHSELREESERHSHRSTSRDWRQRDRGGDSGGNAQQGRSHSRGTWREQYRSHDQFADPEHRGEHSQRREEGQFARSHPDQEDWGWPPPDVNAQAADWQRYRGESTGNRSSSRGERDSRHDPRGQEPQRDDDAKKEKRKIEKLSLTPYASSLLSGDPMVFIEDFKDQMDFYRWEAFTAWTHLRCYTTGRAKKWLKKQTPPVEGTSTDFLAPLFSQFILAMRGDNWRQEQKLRLRAVTQRAGETVVAYAARFEEQYEVYSAACGGALDINDDIDDFIKGLLPTLRQDVRVSGTTGFRAIISYARGRELDEPTSLTEGAADTSSGTTPIKVNALMPAGSRGLTGGGQSEQQGNMTAPNVECYNCGNWGHWARNCNSPRQQRQRSYSPGGRGRQYERNYGGGRDSQSPSSDRWNSDQRRERRQERERDETVKHVPRRQPPGFEMSDDQDARQEVPTKRVTVAATVTPRGGQKVPPPAKVQHQSEEGTSSSDDEPPLRRPAAVAATRSARHGSRESRRSVRYQAELPSYAVQLGASKRRAVTVARLRTVLRSPTRTPVVPSCVTKELPVSFTAAQQYQEEEEKAGRSKVQITAVQVQQTGAVPRRPQRRCQH